MIITCFGILVLLYSYSSGIEQGCENCGCCRNKKCERTYISSLGFYIDNYCTQGCIDGIGGNKCYNKCPDDCLTCKQAFFNNCASCGERKYLSDNKRCVDCPNNCKVCTSATRCQECYSPYYNDGSQSDCSLSCPRNCFCENPGVCSACQDGFFNVSNTCRNACPETCKTCTDESHCQTCKTAYSGDICCVKNGHCLKCSSSKSCEKCLDGYYGDQCGRACPTKCKSSLCNKDNGNCSSCQDGYYGIECGKSCLKTCHNLQCGMINGICLSCDVGLYGNNCTLKCSKTCLNDRCNIQNGHCSEGCMAAYTGVNCTEVNIDREEIAAPVTDTEIGTVIGISVAVLVGIASILVIVSIIIIRRWKINFVMKYQNTSNEASYVNTQLQTTSIEGIGVPVNNDQIDQSEYELLDERNDKHRDEYEQIESVNQ